MSTRRLLGAAIMLAACGVEQELEEVVTATSVPPVPTAPNRLRPPEPYVLGADGTRLTLEQASILHPEGRAWAIVLGKALFWDQQAGSDGNACASCHFAAGADTRITNQLSPGFKDVPPARTATRRSARPDRTPARSPPGEMPSGAMAVANYTLTPADFPLHALSDKRDRNSPIRSTTNDAVSSQGSFDRVFVARRSRTAQPDECSRRRHRVRAHAGARSSRATRRPRSTRRSSIATSGMAARTTCSTASACSACATSTAIRTSG